MGLRHKIKYRLSDVNKKLLPKENIGKSLKNFQKTVSAGGLTRPDNFEDKIEIIIPCYNHSQYLGDAYQSIVSQTWKDKPITITFIDDNSTDSTPKIVQSIQKQKTKNNIRYILNKQNLRQWACINKVVKASQNELFIILNDDDMLMPDALEKTVKTYQKHQEVYMLGAHSLWFEQSKKLPKHNIRNIDDIELTIQTPEMTHKYKKLNDLNMTHSSSSFFKSVWWAVGGYTPKERRINSAANEDRDFQMRVNAVASVGVYYDYPLAYWRTDSSHGKNY
jgi:alpha-1,3-rhamnosyltransferase